MDKIRHLENRLYVIFFCQGWSDLPVFLTAFVVIVTLRMLHNRRTIDLVSFHSIQFARRQHPIVGHEARLMYLAAIAVVTVWINVTHAEKCFRGTVRERRAFPLGHIFCQTFPRPNNFPPHVGHFPWLLKRKFEEWY